MDTTAECRKRFPYIGKPRVEWLHDREGNQYAEKLGGRAFAAPMQIPLIRWTKKWQGWAIDNGFFLERSTLFDPGKGGALAHSDDEHVRVLPLGNYATDQDVMNMLERAIFHRDPFAELALEFIEQQDKYGYSGMWDSITIQTFDHNLLWYKRVRQTKHDRYTIRLGTTKPDGSMWKIDGRARWIVAARAREHARAASWVKRSHEPSAAAESLFERLDRVTQAWNKPPRVWNHDMQQWEYQRNIPLWPDPENHPTKSGRPK